MEDRVVMSTTLKVCLGIIIAVILSYIVTPIWEGWLYGSPGEPVVSCYDMTFHDPKNPDRSWTYHDCHTISGRTQRPVDSKEPT